MDGASSSVLRNLDKAFANKAGKKRKLRKDTRPDYKKVANLGASKSYGQKPSDSSSKRKGHPASSNVVRNPKTGEQSSSVRASKVPPRSSAPQLANSATSVQSQTSNMYTKLPSSLLAVAAGLDSEATQNSLKVPSSMHEYAAFALNIRRPVRADVILASKLTNKQLLLESVHKESKMISSRPPEVFALKKAKTIRRKAVQAMRKCEENSYETLSHVNSFWRAYADEAIADIGKAEEQLQQAGVAASTTKRVSKMEFVGGSLSVLASSVPQNVGTQGIVIDETARNWIIGLENGLIKVLPKETCEVSIPLGKIDARIKKR